MSEDNTFTGERPTIRSDIDYRVIDTVALAGILKERLERNKSYGRAYWDFRRAFYSLFLITKAYLPSKHQEEKAALEVVFYGSGTLAPDTLIVEFDDYLKMLKDSGLIDLGQHETSIR